jgi:alpha-L-rhamnosidase
MPLFKTKLIIFNQWPNVRLYIIRNQIKMKHIQHNLINSILTVLSITLLLISGCGKSHQQTIKNDSPDLQNALWISDARGLPASDSLMYNEFPAPLFRKEFMIKENLKSAILYISSAGYYVASINGKTVGKNYLDPAWTNYRKRIYYTEYDITSDIREGINCLGTTLGNGFYNPLPMRMWGIYNLRNDLPVGKPVFIARLKIEYKDGETEELNTDGSWKYSYGPVLKNNVYLGEEYDAGKEIAGWNSVGFDDSRWEKSVENNGPGGRLVKAFFPPVCVTSIQKPVAVSSPAKGIYILDMGVNFTGLYRIRMNGHLGDTITFRFGERLYKNGTLNPMTTVCGQIKKKGMGGSGSPAVAWETDRYIFGDRSEAWYSPLFTFHIYRYMEISGLKYKPDTSDIEGIALNSNVED